jgi:chorismate mutase
MEALLNNGVPMSKITEELLKKIEEAERIDPNQKIPVIVTFDSDLDISALEKVGLHIEKKFPEINAVAGTITASAAGRLSEIKGVRVIEYDSRAYAL